LSPQSIPADTYQLSHIPACYFISYHLSLFQLIDISSAIFSPAISSLITSVYSS
jgi:hypothetical protein